MAGKKNHLSSHTFLLLSLLLFVAPLAQAEQLPIKRYTTADGLAHDRINRIIQDSHGFLWFCTAGGLSRFDGYKFTNYTVEQGLSHPEVNDLLETRGGVYWAATNNGLCRFDPTGSQQPVKQPVEKNGGSPISKPMFIAYHPSGNEEAQNIIVLKEDSRGGIWCGTRGGLYRLEQSGEKVEFRYADIGISAKTVEDTTIFAILEDRRGMLWIGAGSGLYRRWSDGRVERYSAQQGLPTDWVTALLEDREGQLWAGTPRGLCRIAAESDLKRTIVADLYTTKDGLLSSFVQSLFQSSDGNLWTGMVGGLSKLIPAANKGSPKFQTYTIANGLSDREGFTFAEDRDGNLWIGTESGGAMKIARNGFTAYSKADGLTYIRIASIFEDKAGELCVVGAGNVPGDGIFINRFNGRRFDSIRPNLPGDRQFPGAYWGWYQNHFQDREGEWWISTGDGICRFPKVKDIEQLARARPTVYTSKDGLSGDNVFRAFEDSRGDIWISTITEGKDQLTRWERASESFHRYSHTDGIPLYSSPTAFCEDSAGNLWIGLYTGGLFRYAMGRFDFFSTADGLANGFIRGLYLDHAGRLWVATGGGGLCRTDDPGADHPHFITYTTKDGLSNNFVTCVTEDQWGRIYIGTTHGLDRLDPIAGRIEHYTVADGLANNYISVSFRDRDGTLWFGTLQGLSRFVPEPDRSASPPPVFIGGLLVAGSRHRISELGVAELSGLEFGANQNSVQVDFFGLGFGMGESLRYQYKLEGAGSDWNAPIDGRAVNYENLSPGNYRFMVRAVNSEGLTSATPAIVSFKILPPIWRRWWFLTLAGVLLGSIVYFVDRYRIKRIIELERVRTRIASDLHDDIGSGLTRIAILSEIVGYKVSQGSLEVSEPLSMIAGASRELVDSMSDIVWAINPNKDRLHDLVQRMRRFAGDVFTARNIEFQFHAPSPEQDLKIGADARRQIYLIFKEAVNNIARHSDCTEAGIEFRVEKGWALLRLSDNGKGLDPERASDGNGLSNMRLRAERMGGDLQIVSNNGKGVAVVLKAPLVVTMKRTDSPAR